MISLKPRILYWRVLYRPGMTVLLNTHEKITNPAGNYTSEVGASSEKEQKREIAREIAR